MATDKKRKIHNICVRASETEALALRGYIMGTKIGKGSYATVFLAHYVDGEQRTSTLACKVFDMKKAPSVFIKKFFPRELEILKRLEHPAIIQIHSILQRDNKYYIFMRYAENGDLLSYVTKNGAIAESQCKIWIQQLVSALEYLHINMNIAHRDLKCENILLTKGLNAKLADFGFAKMCEGKNQLSQTYCGSAMYACPEIISGVIYNPKIADIWSLGVILFTIGNATMPFDDKNLVKLLMDQENRSYRFSSAVEKRLSFEYKILVHGMLDPDISTRLTLEEIKKSQWLSVKNECL